MKILLPVAGATPFFPADEFPFPKPLVEMMERPMIAWAIDNLNELEGDPHFVFIAMQDETTQYSLDGVFRLVTGGRCDVVKLPARTAGALCSCLLAIEHIDPELPLLIANYDQVIEGELPDFIARLRSKNADAGVLTFDATHPRWSYVRTEQGYVVEASEKRVISKEAIAGLYWFARGADFIEAAQNVIRAGDTVNGVYFIASSLNQMILAGKRVASIPMRDQSRLHSFFLPARVHAFEEEMRSRVADASRAALPAKPVHVVIPAAGEGSRFAKAGYGAPKPFIDVLGKPMLTHVLDNVAIRDAQYTLLLREAHLGLSPDAEAEIARRSAHIIPVARLTEGTACTVLLARSAFDDEAPLLVVNSDQLVNFSCQDFVDDARRRGLDGSILVFRDPHRDPKWSFAAIDDAGFVTEVAEKQPISDFATVGIYLFMEGQSFVRAAIDMIANNDRVNGEFYTCPVYNYMIRAGARIGIYEVPFDAMTGLGTPEDMEAYLTLKGGPGTRSADAPGGLKAMEVVVPLAGNDFERPDGTTKAEMLVDGQPLLLRALWSRSWWRRGDVAASNFCFVLRDTAVGRRFAEGPLTDWFPGARHVFLSHMTAGAAFSVAAGVALCDPLAPLCIDLADILYQEDFDATATFAADAGLGGIALTFCSDLPVYSYVRTDGQGRVLEAAEKRVISGDASAGTYFFRNAGIYAQALGHAVTHRESQTHQGIYFVCPLFNGVIDAGLDVRSVPVREILDIKI